jgi:phosphosulfolactate synthase (CoM biosynthesis protein A)
MQYIQCSSGNSVLFAYFIISKKPRKEGLTCIVDRLQALDKDNFEIVSPYIDLVKIHNDIPILISEAVLEKKIKFYQLSKMMRNHTVSSLHEKNPFWTRVLARTKPE